MGQDRPFGCATIPILVRLQHHAQPALQPIPPETSGLHAVQVGLKPALRALGLGDGGVLVMRRPAQLPLAGALPEIEIAVGVATPELQRKYEQRCRQAQQQVRQRMTCVLGCCLCGAIH